MQHQEKQINYTTTNTYATLNTLSDKTKNVWIVCHGIGYLSRYFISHFDTLNADENYIIAPQAPSKYYLDKNYKRVGASWLTKENTVLETTNIISYLDAVYASENIPSNCNIIILGFSQGVSIACRWVVKKQLKCHHLVLYAGKVPNELNQTDFNFLKLNNTKITTVLGDKDEYITQEIVKTEALKIESLFQGRAKNVVFDGVHEMKREVINSLV